MPKLSKRRQPHLAPRSAAVLSQQARKVSFEEGSAHSASSDSLKSSSSLTLIPRTSPCTNMLLMSSLLERKPTPTTCLSEMDSDEDSQLGEIRSRTVSQEEEQDCFVSSPWGQFVDVIPEDYGCWSTPCYQISPVLHSGPAYHPYLRSPRRQRQTTGALSPIPNKTSPTRKLQQRRMMEVEGAFELLRFWMYIQEYYKKRFFSTARASFRFAVKIHKTVTHRLHIC
jgi:hypothetical protein